MGGLCIKPESVYNSEILASSDYKDSNIKQSKSGRNKIDTKKTSYMDNMIEEENEEMEKMSLAKSKVKDFKTLIFEKINELRTNPKLFSDYVESAINLIKYDEENKKYYFDKSEVVDEKIYLKKGLQTFKNTVNYLKGVYPLPALIYKENLELEIDDLKEDWTKREKLTLLLQKKTYELENVYSGFSFHFDTNVRDPILSTVIQVVDDGPFYGQRRNNILSHQLKYIGITHSDLNIKEKICLYFNLAY